MKVITILILFTVISIINSSLNEFTSKSCTDYFNKQGVDESTQAFSKDFCRTLKVSDSSNLCCFLKYKMETHTFYNCAEVNQAEFQDIDQKISNLETSYSFNVKSLECSSSSYLFGSLLLLLVFLF